MNTSLCRSLAVAVVVMPLLASCQRTADVSYARDVAPIIDEHCSQCHVTGQPGFVASGLDTTSYEALMRGTRFGAVVLPGDPLTSTLVMLIEGRADPSLKMPHGDAKPLDAKAIATVRQWVEQGARNN
jgi:uncharacterized membrane protein